MEDGTRNQRGPLDQLIDKLELQGTKTTQSISSLDLSAATDRLPVDLQAQILSILGVRGDL
jgi:hypothetical protein